MTTLDEANFAFVQSLLDRAALVNRPLAEARRRGLEEEIRRANNEENAPAYQAQLANWRGTIDTPLAV